MEGHVRSRKVKEGHGWSLPITRLTFQMRKVKGGVGCWPVGLYCQPQSHSLSSGLWIWELDLGLGFGTGLELDNKRNNMEKQTIVFCLTKGHTLATYYAFISCIILHSSCYEELAHTLVFHFKCLYGHGHGVKGSSFYPSPWHATSD